MIFKNTTIALCIVFTMALMACSTTTSTTMKDDPFKCEEGKTQSHMIMAQTKSGKFYPTARTPTFICKAGKWTVPPQPYPLTRGDIYLTARLAGDLCPSQSEMNLISTTIESRPIDSHWLEKINYELTSYTEGDLRANFSSFSAFAKRWEAQGGQLDRLPEQNELMVVIEAVDRMNSPGIAIMVDRQSGASACLD